MGDHSNEICFVISPIGKEDSETHEKFKEIYDHIIKPAIKYSGYKLEVIRADDIKKPGSWINDILKYLQSSFIVIADLTDQNPNVFYELGVRHSLSPRTILIAQSTDDIPSDLRSYRSIVYTTDLKGPSKFRDELNAYLKEIHNDPNFLDNPVIDHLSGILNKKIEDLENENTALRQEINDKCSKKITKKNINEDFSKQLLNILKVLNIKKAEIIDFDVISFDSPISEGNFECYTNSQQLFYLAKLNELNFRKEMGDIRVLMANVTNFYNGDVTFVIAVNSDLSSEINEINDLFEKMKNFIIPEFRNRFELEIWDENVLLEKEKSLGIKID